MLASIKKNSKSSVGSNNSLFYNKYYKISYKNQFLRNKRDVVLVNKVPFSKVYFNHFL